MSGKEFLHVAFTFNKYFQRRQRMNWDQIQGKWKQFRGAARAKWGDLTDSDFERINGNREQLIGLIQERYGIAKDAAERQVNERARSVETEEPGTRRKVG